MRSARTSQCIGSESLFTRAWAENFVEAWNTSSWRKDFRAAGKVLFELEVDDAFLRNSHTSVLFVWDDEGSVKALPLEQAADDTPRFRGNALAWELVMSGARSPVGAVLAGHLHYRGPFSFAVRYGVAFTAVVEVAQSL